MNTNDPRPATYALTPAGQKELTANELTSLEKIAILRGKCGRYRRAIRDAIDQLPEGNTVRSFLLRELEEAA